MTLLFHDVQANSDSMTTSDLPLCLGPSYHPRALASGRLAYARARTVLTLRPTHGRGTTVSTLHWRLLLVAEGALTVPRTGLHLPEGEAMLVHPGSTGELHLASRTRVLHLLFAVTPVRIVWRGLRPVSTEDRPQPGGWETWGVALPQRLDTRRALALRNLIQHLRIELGASCADNLRADARLAYFLSDLVAEANGEAGRGGAPTAGDGSHMGRILALARNLATRNGRVTVADLAQQAGISQRQLQREFAVAGLSAPRAWIERLRLEHAAQELQRSSELIHHAALRLGYRSDAAFSRAFTRVMGVSPMRWRRQC